MSAASARFATAARVVNGEAPNRGSTQLDLFVSPCKHCVPHAKIPKAAHQRAARSKSLEVLHGSWKVFDRALAHSVSHARCGF